MAIDRACSWSMAQVSSSAVNRRSITPVPMKALNHGGATASGRRDRPCDDRRVDHVEVVVAHRERAVVRVGDVFLKVDVDARRTAAELDAMRLAGIPTPAVLWHEPPVVALAALPGRPLARLGAVDASSATAWAAAGAAARALHAAPLPPIVGWRAADFASYADTSVRWIVDHGVLDASIVDPVRRRMDGALRDFPLVFTHGDFQAAHVFVEDDQVVGVVDWADACQGDALYDLAVLTAGHEERLDAVVAGYGTEVDREVIRGWWAFRRLAAVPWMIDHGFDAGGDIEVLRTMARS